MNVWFDIAVWSELLADGGIIAVHDTDDRRFADARRAVFEFSRSFELWAHPAGMVLLRKSMSNFVMNRLQAGF